ncbi:MAG: hypothetical protein AAGJ81_00755 [Verrucomicrobiota bacterium]
MARETAGADRKRLIVNRLLKGEKQVRIAEELGVTRQAISFVWKAYQKDGDKIFETPGKGRRKEADILSPVEETELIRWLRSNSPKEIGLLGTTWNLRSVKRAIKIRYGKSVRIAIAHKVFQSAFAAVIAEEATTPSLPVDLPLSTPGEGSKDGISGFSEEFPSIEEMARVNRETRISNSPEFSSDSHRSSTTHGVRTGKHAKGKRSPRKKVKRRKK